MGVLCCRQAFDYWEDGYEVWMALQSAPQYSQSESGRSHQAVGMMATMSLHPQTPAILLAALLTTSVVKMAHMIGAKALQFTVMCQRLLKSRGNSTVY